ncbi:hypothetical protein KC345_g3 [Hortaea werneckii]|nr:hypothetical protein KC345_g3 [Hortaea werneckii]
MSIVANTERGCEEVIAILFCHSILHPLTFRILSEVDLLLKSVLEFVHVVSERDALRERNDHTRSYGVWSGVEELVGRLQFGRNAIVVGELTVSISSAAGDEEIEGVQPLMKGIVKL